MYPEDAVNAKMQAERNYENTGCAAPAPQTPYPDAIQGFGAQASTPSRLGYSLRDEAAKRAQHYHSEGEKAQSAAQFFAMNPQFEDFIRLVRSGAIQF